MDKPLTMQEVERQFALLENPPTDVGSFVSEEIEVLVFWAGRSGVRLSYYIDTHAPEPTKISELGLLNRRLTALRMRSLELTYYLQQVFPKEKITEKRVKEHLLEFCLLVAQKSSLVREPPHE